MTRLQAARASFTRHWYRSDRQCQPWAMNIWELAIEPITKVREIAASLALDGYPAKWPRTAARKGTER